MAIAGAHDSAVEHGHRLRRRNRRRTNRTVLIGAVVIGAWGAFFLVLGWLVAAGIYGLLANP
jgi:hypothetical protein